MFTKNLRRHPRERRGAAAVELAVVLPLFFLLIFGMIEYGRLVMVQQIITNAAREGARVAILTTATTSSVTTAVTSYLTNAGITGETVTVSPSPPSSAAAGTGVTVTVSIPYKSVSWFTPIYLGSTTMTSSVVMRTEVSAGS